MNTLGDNSPYIVEVTAQNVQQAVLEASSSVPVLLDVWADWCEPCKVLTPILEQLVEQYGGRFILAKLDADDQKELSDQLGVQSLPALKLVVDGQVVGELSGVQPVGVIRELLDQHVEPDESVVPNLSEDIRTAIAEGDTDTAQQLLTQAMTEYPEDKTYQFLAVELLISAAEISAAKERFEGLGSDERNSEEGKRIAAKLYFSEILETASPDVDYSKQLDVDPGDADALYYLAATMVRLSRYDEALETAWHLFQFHGSYKSGEAKVVLLNTFDLLGKSDPRAQKYRRKMFNFLH